MSRRFQADPVKWDYWPEIRRVNPLTAISPMFRRKLREERDAAHRDTRLRARWLSYRMNVPSGDESTMLLTRRRLATHGQQGRTGGGRTAHSGG